MKQTIYSIQLLRALAAFLVLLLHTFYKETVYSNGIFTGFHFGHIGVDIFFIVSGFIMLHTIKENTHPLDFLLKRFIRIYPIYWLTSIVALIGYIVVPHLVNSGREADLIASLFLLPTQVGYLNPNAWTLSFELLFYFILFVVLLISFRFRVVLSTLIVLVLGSYGLLAKPESNWASFIFDSILFEFVLGFVIYGIYCNFVRLNRYLLLLRILSVILFSILWNIGSELRFVHFGGMAFCICIFCLSFEPLMQTKKSSLMMKLGDSSYSLYLTHAFVLSGAGFLFSKVNLIVDNSYIFVFLLLSISLVVGYYSFKFIEQPLTRYILRYYKVVSVPYVHKVSTGNK